MSFEKCVEFVLKHEGGYVNNPRDPGGETKFGIAKKFYPSLDIKNLTTEQAKKIYFDDYWLRSKCDQLPDKVAMMVFDSSVNQGIVASAKILQRSLKIKDDGVIGSGTIGAAKSANVNTLIQEMAAQRANYYAATRNVDTFGLGWYRRLVDCFVFSMSLK